eukprot:1394981-Amorphochlora_amoeboformis.AAC.3
MESQIHSPISLPFLLPCSLCLSLSISPFLPLSSSLLLSSHQTERFEDKDTIIRQGDAPDAFYLILDGAARVLVSPEDASSKSRENEDDAKQLGILVT